MKIAKSETFANRHSLAVATFGLALFGLAACGGDGASEEPSDDASEAEAAEAESGESESDEVFDVRFGGAASGSGAQQRVAGIADLGSQAENLRVSPITTPGFPGNLRFLRSGELEFGYAESVHYLEARDAIGEFEGEEPVTNVQAIGAEQIISIFMACDASLGVTNLSETAGLTIATGVPGSGLDFTGGKLLEAYGLVDQVQVERIDVPSSAEAIIEGTVDCITGAGAGFPNFLQAGEQIDLVLLNYDDDEINESLSEELAAPVIVRSPDETYDWQEEPVQVFGSAINIVVRDDVPDAAVYTLLEQITSDDAVETMRSITPNFETHNSMTLLEEGAFLPEGLGLTLHPGAVQFWTDQGFEIPDYAVGE